MKTLLYSPFLFIYIKSEINDFSFKFPDIRGRNLFTMVKDSKLKDWQSNHFELKNLEYILLIY